MDIKAYLERIDYRGPLVPSAQTLRELQVAHLLTVPFENLSIHSGERIILEEDALFDKVVGRRRGGFCYELNGLFSALLRGLGFEVTMLSAGVANASGGFGPDFDHMALMVVLDERWLVDVGFGDSYREPLLLDGRAEQTQGRQGYRIVHDGDWLTLTRRADEGDWTPQYRFTLRPHQFSDYAEMCQFHQTSPQSHFTRARICSRATAEGRITLSDKRFIATTLNGDRKELELKNEAEYESNLKENFGIVVAG